MPFLFCNFIEPPHKRLAIGKDRARLALLKTPALNGQEFIKRDKMIIEVEKSDGRFYVTNMSEVSDDGKNISSTNEQLYLPPHLDQQIPKKCFYNFFREGHD
jgi:hypothetical protein